MSRREPLRITLFSDFTSPYGYVTEAALHALDPASVEIHLRAFELYPAPAPLPASPVEPGWHERIRPFAEAEGLPLQEPPPPPRTRKAHEAARFAAEHGRARDFRQALYRAYWAHGEDIGRIDVLTRLAAGGGLDSDELKIALDIDRYAPEVERDLALARQLRIAVVPTLYLGTGPAARILVGAQSRTDLDEAIRSR